MFRRSMQLGFCCWRTLVPQRMTSLRQADAYKLYSATSIYGTVWGRPFIKKKTYKRDSPIPIHPQESGPGDGTLYADIPCI